MLILTSHSYKGGTGKTVVAVNLANVLHKLHGKKVLLLELDTVAPSFVDIFVNVNPSKFWDDFLGGLSLDDIIYEWKGIDLVFSREPEHIPVSPGSDFITAAKDKLSKFSDHLRRLQNKKGYDFVIIDTRAGKHGELFLPIPLSHVVLLTTRLDGHSIKKTMKLYEEFYLDFPSLKMFFIENQVPLLEDELKVDRAITAQIEKNNEIWHDFIDKYKEMRFIDVVTIPLSIEIAYSVMSNVVVDPDSGNPLIKYIEDITRKLLKG